VRQAANRPARPRLRRAIRAPSDPPLAQGGKLRGVPQNGRRWLRMPRRWLISQTESQVAPRSIQLLTEPDRVLRKRVDCPRASSVASPRRQETI
jgi:hypothetical protein